MDPQMDPRLWEAFHGDDEIVEAVARVALGAELPPGVDEVSRFGDVVTCRLARRTIPAVRRYPTVRSLKAANTLSTTTMQTIAAAPLPRRRPLQARGPAGAGVVLAVVDWGCDFAHSAFRRPDGSSRLLALWDQRGRHPESPEPYGYGRVFDAVTINHALAEPEPYAALGYHPGEVDAEGLGTHGTHVLGIGASLAPEAHLVFVHLADRGTSSEALGSSVRLLEALDFIDRIAGALPCVINLSMGRHGGPHDGTSLFELAIGDVVRQRGRVVVQSAGNYFAAQTHAEIHLGRGSREVRIDVPTGDTSPNEIDAWYSGDDDVVATLIAPNGSVALSIALDERKDIRIGDTVVGRAYHRRRDPGNLDNNLWLRVDATPDTVGRWRLAFEGRSVSRGRVDVWIERDPSRTGQARFAEEDATATCSTGTICHAAESIGVGAYDPHATGRPLASFSSSGPTRNGATKPDLLGPGVGILSACSAPFAATAPDDRQITKSGTSMASPHVAAAAALLLSENPLLVPAEVKRVLLSTADPAIGLDAQRAGAGYLNLERAFARVIERREQVHLMDVENIAAESQSNAIASFAPYESPEAATDLRVRVVNRLLPAEEVDHATVTLRPAAGGAAVANAVTPANGLATLPLAGVPDGAYRLSIAPQHTTVDPVGPAIGGAGAPDRIFRGLDVDVTVTASRVTAVAGAGGALTGANAVRASLQPVWMRSPNRTSPRSLALSHIIVHHTGGPAIGPALNTFLNPRSTSAHYVIDVDGQVVKMVHEADAASHAGCSFWEGRESVNRFSVGIEVVNRDGAYPDEQYAALIALLGAIVAAYPDIDTSSIVGHSDIATNCRPGGCDQTNPCVPTGPDRRLGRKSSDPGLELDWARLEAAGFGLRIRTPCFASVAGIYGGFYDQVPAGQLRHGDRDSTHRYGAASHPSISGIVSELQRDLLSIGYYCRDTGLFDDATEWAVRMLQEHFYSGSRQRVLTRGRVDRQTAELIKQLSACKRPPVGDFPLPSRDVMVATAASVESDEASFDEAHPSFDPPFPFAEDFDGGPPRAFSAAASFARALDAAGLNGRAPLADLFDRVQRTRSAPAPLSVLAMPGERPREALRPGCVVVLRALGEGRVAAAFSLLNLLVGGDARLQRHGDGGIVTRRLFDGPSVGFDVLVIAPPSFGEDVEAVPFAVTRDPQLRKHVPMPVTYEDYVSNGASTPLAEITRCRCDTIGEVDSAGQFLSFINGNITFHRTVIDALPATKRLWQVTATGQLEAALDLQIVHPADTAGATALPAGSEKFPLVIICMGNHTALPVSGSGSGPVITSLSFGTEIRSHEGYPYLQDALAVQGFISVSVSTNPANLLNLMIETRADLVIAAIAEMRRLAGTAGSRYHNRIDFDRVALVGHSRGGDAVMRAAHKQRGSNVRAVVQLSSTDLSGLAGTAWDPLLANPVMPTCTKVTTQRTPHSMTAGLNALYLAVYGSRDGDVSGFKDPAQPDSTGHPFRHYDRSSAHRAFLFWHGATHNRFNRLWTDDEEDGNDNPARIDRAGGRPLLPRADQEARTIEAVVGWLRFAMKHEWAQADLFNGRTPSTVAPSFPVSAMWKFGRNLKTIDRYDDGSAATSTIGGTNTAAPTTIVSEMVMNTDNAADAGLGHERLMHIDHVVRAQLPPSGATSGRWSTTIPSGHKNFSSFTHLTLRAMKRYSEAAIILARGASAIVPFGASFFLGLPRPVISIQLSDIHGANHTETLAGALTALPDVRRITTTPDMQSAFPSVTFPTQIDLTKYHLETIEAPLAAFRSHVDLGNITQVAVELAASSGDAVYVDTVSLVAL